MRISGRGVCPGAAMAAAIVIRNVNGRPQLPERLSAAYGTCRAITPDARPAAILVATHADHISAFSWNDFDVQGVVVQNDADSTWACNFPIVDSIAENFDGFADGDLLIVDGDRGFVVVGPNAQAVSEYQAESERRISRSRYFIDDAHLHSKTREGRTVRVGALVFDDVSVDMAIEAGADELFIPWAELSWSHPETEAEQEALLLPLMTVAAGKPVVLLASLGVPDSGVLLGLANTVDLTVAIACGTDEWPRWLEDLKTTGHALNVLGQPWRPVKCALRLDQGSQPDEWTQLQNVFRIVIDGRLQGLDSEFIADVSSAARSVGVPLCILVGAETPLAEAIALGADCVVVTPERTAAAKQDVRTWETDLPYDSRDYMMTE